MDKEKKKYLFLVSITVIGIILGIVFANILNDNDQLLVEDKLTNYFVSIQENKDIDYLGNFLNSFFNNNMYLLIVWILGVSIIGIVLNNFVLFFKGFVVGFSIGSIINIYLYKGIIGALLYIFPHHILNVLIMIVLIYHANNFSIRLFKALFLKKETKLSEIMPKYLKILLYGFIGFLVSTILETFLSPLIIKLFTFMLE